MHDELDKVTKQKQDFQNEFNRSSATLNDSTKEMKDINDAMAKFERRIRELEDIVNVNRSNVTRLETELEDLNSKESLLKETLGQLIKRREKVRAIYTGPLSKIDE